MTPDPVTIEAPRRKRGRWPLLLLALFHFLALAFGLVIFASVMPMASASGPIPLSAGYPGLLALGLLVAWHARPQSGIAIDDRSAAQRIKLAALSVILFAAGVYAGLDFLAEVEANLDDTLFHLEAHIDSAAPPAE